MKTRKSRTLPFLNADCGLDRTVVFEIAALAVVLFFSTLVFMYTDIVNTIDNSNILLRAIKHAQPLKFYEWSVDCSATNYAANYNFAIYVLFAIWQAPMYLLAHITGRVYMQWPLALLWSKLLVVLFSAAVALLIYKIVLFCTGGNGRKRALLAVVLYYGSVFTFYPVFLCGQLDSICMTFMLSGVYYYLTGSTKRFWLFFLLAAPFKLFALILALPLVLMRQKNLLKAVPLWASMAGLLVVEKLLFHGSAVYKYALGAQSRDAMDGLLGASISPSFPITLFLLCYFAVLLYAWMKEEKSAGATIHMCFFVWATFITLSEINTYWVFLAVPFMVMSMCVNDRFIRYTTLLETASSAGYFLYVAARAGILRDDELVSRLLLPKMMAIPAADQLKYTTLSNLFAANQWDRYVPLFSTVFIFSLFAILALTAPRLQNEDDTEHRRPERWVMLLRPVLLGCAVALTVYAYTAKTNPVAYDTRDAEYAAGSVNLISSERDNVVTQPLVFPDDRKLDELVLRFENTYYRRANMALLYIELWNTDTDECIFQDVVGCSFIEDDTDLSIDLKGAAVTAGEHYEIRCFGKPGNAYYHWNSLYPYFTSTTEDGLDHAFINGEAIDGCLYFEIR